MGIFDSSRKRLSQLEHEVLSNPTPQNMVSLAESYARLGDLRHALDVAKRAVEKFPDSEKCALTFQHIRKQQFTSEIQELNRAIRARPTQQHYERLAQICLGELGDRNKALEVAMEGLHKFPSSDGLHVICAQVRFDRFHSDYTANDAAEAIRHAEHALQMNRDSGPAMYILGRLYAEVGAFDKAKPMLDGYLRVDPGNTSMKQLGKHVDGHITESVESVDDALSDIEARHALPTVGKEVLQFFGEHAGGDTQVTISPAKLEGFLRGFDSMHGYKCSVVLTRDGTQLAAHTRGMIQQDKFITLVQSIYRCAEDATRRMDLGDFRDGEIKTSVGTVRLSEHRKLVIGLLADAPAKPEDFDRAIEKFHSFIA